ncbi:MAG: FAD-binding protein [Saprospiraceae bacterium]
MPVTPRGTGTSLAGQTVGSGLVLDMNKYQNQIIEINAGKIMPSYNQEYFETPSMPLAKNTTCICSDPATSNRASIGGMIANSSGTRSILYR